MLTGIAPAVSGHAAEHIDPARYHLLAVTVTIDGRRLHTMHKVVTSQAVAHLGQGASTGVVERVAQCRT
jgi:hypothetical protein